MSVKNLDKEGRRKLKEKLETAVTVFLEEVTGSKVVTLHHDISTATGEEVVLFTLGESPLFREMKRK